VDEELKILLLEDNSTDAEITRRLLLKQQPGYHISIAYDRDSYVAALDEFQPDVILSDHSLPQFDSTEALSLARKKIRDVPFIMVTGTVSEEFAAGIMRSGADDYILKDRLKRLPTAIEKVVGQKRIAGEKQQAEQKLIQSEANLRAIFENTAEGFLLLDRNGFVKVFNNIAATFRSCVTSEIIGVGDRIQDFVKGREKIFLEQVIARVLNGETVHYEYSCKEIKGRITWLDFSIMPVREAAEITGICASVRDVTQRKLAEQEKEFDGNNVSALINNTKDLMWSIDLHFKLITFNTAFAEYVHAACGYSLKKQDSILATFQRTESWKGFKKYYERAFKGESFTVTIRHSTTWSEISFYPIYNASSVVGTACFSRDITERKNSELALKALEDKISDQKLQDQKKITQTVIRAQEKERNHLGQELHDNINQILAASKMHLDIAGRDNEEVKRLTQYPKELLNLSINEIRELSRRQVTPLKDVNLKELLERIIADLQKMGSIQTSFTFDFTPHLPDDDLKLNIYRIVQEQVNNILKHAGAKKVIISVTAAGNLIHIMIKDDGKGFDTSKARKGIGISNIINRTESFNGTITITSSPGKGCSLDFSMPFQ
jgi:PAS domain S-box-containing protein